MTEFRISSYCTAGGCVEAGQLPGGSVAVRDSKDPGRRTVLVFTPEEWSEFVTAVKDGSFDVI